MKRQTWQPITIALLAVAFTACGIINPPLTTQHDEGDEESSTQFTKDETYDMTRGGARLILSYDANKEAFIGTVENTTSNTLKRVRVEVHLSNGTELGQQHLLIYRLDKRLMSSLTPKVNLSIRGLPTLK